MNSSFQKWSFASFSMRCLLGAKGLNSVEALNAYLLSGVDWAIKSKYVNKMKLQKERRKMEKNRNSIHSYLNIFENSSASFIRWTGGILLRVYEMMNWDVWFERSSVNFATVKVKWKCIAIKDKMLYTRSFRALSFRTLRWGRAHKIVRQPLGWLRLQLRANVGKFFKQQQNREMKLLKFVPNR